MVQPEFEQGDATQKVREPSSRLPRMRQGCRVKWACHLSAHIRWTEAGEDDQFRQVCITPQANLDDGLRFCGLTFCRGALSHPCSSSIHADRCSDAVRTVPARQLERNPVSLTRPLDSCRSMQHASLTTRSSAQVSQAHWFLDWIGGSS